MNAIARRCLVVFAAFASPGATAGQTTWIAELLRVSTSAEMAERMQRALSEIDVRDLHTSVGQSAFLRVAAPVISASTVRVICSVISRRVFQAK